MQNIGTGAQYNLPSLESHRDMQTNEENSQRIYALQERLALLGFYRAEPNGVFDEYTLWCLNRFQAVCDLPLTQFADSNTLRLLETIFNEQPFLMEDTQLDYAISLIRGSFYDPGHLWENIFNDVPPGAWYYDAVAFANYHGLFSGVGDNRFSPQGSMTRAMFVTVLWNLEGKPGVSGNSVPLFDDVSEGLWFYEAVMWAAENGIVGGVGNNRFAPQNSVSRQEMAVMLVNYAQHGGYEIPVRRSTDAFTDLAQVASWADAAVKALISAEVLSGDNNMFRPQNEATRAQVAQMFRNFMKIIAEPN